MLLLYAGCFSVSIKPTLYYPLSCRGRHLQSLPAGVGHRAFYREEGSGIASTVRLFHLPHSAGSQVDQCHCFSCFSGSYLTKGGPWRTELLACARNLPVSVAPLQEKPHLPSSAQLNRWDRRSWSHTTVPEQQPLFLKHMGNKSERKSAMEGGQRSPLRGSQEWDVPDLGTRFWF